MVDLFDNMGVLIGLARKCGFMRPDGEIRNLDKAFITDSIGTMFSACMGTTTATSYLESASGVAAGGRTGLTAVTTAGCFLTIMTMPFTFNIATGFGFGFVSYTVIHVLMGRWREVTPFMYLISACFVANFIMRT